MDNRHLARPPFHITGEQAASFAFSEEPLRAADIVARFNALIDTTQMGKLPSQALTALLFHHMGYLSSTPHSSGTILLKRPSRLGLERGVSSQTIDNGTESYTIITYSLDVQRDIVREYEALNRFAEAVTRMGHKWEKGFLGWNFGTDERPVYLDGEQRLAAAINSNCLLVAGAGAGKTATMAARVSWLCHIEEVEPENILVVAYTNKAAQELRERICDGMHLNASVSTFHSLAWKLCRQAAGEAVRVCENQERRALLLQALTERISEDSGLLEQLMEYMGNCLNFPEDTAPQLGETLEDFHTRILSQAPEGEALEQFVLEEIRRRAHSLQSLRGETLRSRQEVEIANYLFIMGIPYTYEKPYPHGALSAQKVYTPDFFLEQNGRCAWLEHYSLDDTQTDGPYGPERMEQYRKSIRDKRALHQSQGTSLLETWAQYADGRSLREHLRETLLEHGFTPRQHSYEELYAQLVRSGQERYIERLATFLGRFYSLYQASACEGFEELRAQTEDASTLFFLDLAEPILARYNELLRQRNMVDFGGMITQAIQALAEGKVQVAFSHIIIDEFQDISRQRFRFLSELVRVTGAQVAAVGDDWQSIFSFSGARLPLFTRFLELIEPMAGRGVELKITRTYRNPQALIDIAGGFIQKNSEQKRKSLLSQAPNRDLEEPVRLIEYGEDPCSEAARLIDDITEQFGEDAEILLLGRYHHSLRPLARSPLFHVRQQSGIVECLKHPETRIRFLTVHSAKGLGADNVIVLDVSEGVYGFPSEMDCDPILDLVTYRDHGISCAEERRLFYVALTRTKNTVYVLYPRAAPSRFIRELSDDFGLAKREPTQTPNERI